MKRKQLVFRNLLVTMFMIVSTILIFSCSEEDGTFINEGTGQFEVNPELNKKTADLVLELSTDKSIITEIYKAVEQRTLGETSVLIEYLLGPDNKGITGISRGTFADKFFNLTNEGTKLKSGGNNPESGLLSDILNGKVQICWPYYKNWDGKTFPAVSFYDGVNEYENIGYRFVNGKKEEVIVNDDYAWENPVWIINQYSGDPQEFLAELELMKKQKETDYLTSSALKAGSFNHIALEIERVKCHSDPDVYEGVFGGDLELRWVRAHSQDIEDEVFNVDLMRLQNAKVSYTLDRGDARNKVWKGVNSPWITDWTTLEESFWIGVFEQDAGDWKASGNGNFDRKKSTEKNVDVKVDLGKEDNNIKFTYKNVVQTASAFNVIFDWSIESKEDILGSMEWARTWVENQWPEGTRFYTRHNGIETSWIKRSW